MISFILGFISALAVEAGIVILGLIVIVAVGKAKENHYDD